MKQLGKPSDVNAKTVHTELCILVATLPFAQGCTGTNFYMVQLSLTSFCEHVMDYCKEKTPTMCCDCAK